MEGLAWGAAKVESLPTLVIFEAVEVCLIVERLDVCGRLLAKDSKFIKSSSVSESATSSCKLDGKAISSSELELGEEKAVYEDKRQNHQCGREVSNVQS
jgi:hypothetical protein